MADETNAGGLTDAERERFIASLRQNLGYKISPIIAEVLAGHVDTLVAEREAARDAAWNELGIAQVIAHLAELDLAKRIATQQSDTAWAAKIEALAEDYERDATQEPYGGEPWSTTAVVVRALLTAEHAKALDAVKAAAWDEGRRFGQQHWSSNFWPEVKHKTDPNPYRADRLTTDTP